MTNQETLVKNIDLKDEVLTVRDLINRLSEFDQDALILIEDVAAPIYLEIDQITQTTQEGCGGEIITVYLTAEQ
jgi:hypothetical protein